MNAPLHRKRRTKPAEGLFMRAVKKDVKVEVNSLAEALEMPLAETGLAVRTVNMLEGVGILIVSNLLSQSSEQLLGILNFGEKTLRELVKMCQKINVEPPDEWLERLKQFPPKSSKKKPPHADQSEGTSPVPR